MKIKNSVEEYLNQIRPYFKDIINNFKKSDMWKIQITIVINFISSMDNGEKHVMHSKSDGIEIMMNDEADEFIKKIFDSLKNRYQNNQWKVVNLSSMMFIYCIMSKNKPELW